MTSVLGQTFGFQGEIYERARPRRLGTFAKQIETGTGFIVAGEITKVATIAFATESGTQTVTIDGVAISFATGGSSAATAVNGANAINATYSIAGGTGTPPVGAAISQRVIATTNTNTLIITGRFGGDNFPITYSGTGGTLVQDGTGGSRIAAVAPSLQYGRVVGFNAGDSFVDENNLPLRYPNSSSTIIVGISGGSSIIPYSGASVPTYQRGDVAVFLKKGTVVTELDTVGLSIVPGDPVYYRHTANGVLNKLGAIDKATGTGLSLLANARFDSIPYLYEGIPVADVAINLA